MDQAIGTGTATHTLVMWAEPTLRADALGGGAVPPSGFW